MNITTLHATREALRTELARLDAIRPMCSTCKHYELQFCTVAQAAPPGEWFHPKEPITCESWEHDKLPF